MRPQQQVAAESVWFHRIFSRGPARVSISGEVLRMDGRSGELQLETRVGSINEIEVRRSWFRDRLTVIAAGGLELSIGGLDERAAAHVRDAVLRKATLHAEALGPDLKLLDRRISEFLAGDRYIRHSGSSEFHAEITTAVNRCGRLVRENLESGAREAFNRLARLAPVKIFELARERANEAFVLDSVAPVKDSSSTALSVHITDEQAVAVATDEDATLVLAGAGTGKTAVTVGKIAHLVRNQGVRPEEILALAYNRKAADELRERLPKDLSATHVSTFHALGRRVIAESGVAPTISKLAEDESALIKVLEGILRELLNDPTQSKAVADFIAYHQAPYRSAFDFESPAEYGEYVRGVELRTLSKHLVKSFEELTIANYLTEHGVEFRYEDQYRVRTATQRRRQYQPDFFLPGHNIYIEHFALDEGGSPPSHWKGYAEGVEWKRGIHRRNRTKLIETYSWQHRRGILLSTLRSTLIKEGVRFQRISHQALVAKLAQQPISWLARLLAVFLHHVKTSDLKPDELRARARELGDRRRNEAFLDVFEQALVRYQRSLANEKALDFHDLINLAARRIRECKWKPEFRYVLVDEFQDISAGRMRLLQALRSPKTAFFLVGDDWQSIYRFAGSDVGLLRDCGEYLGRVRTRTLSNTFRFREGILSPSTAFVQRNPEQTRRPLLSASSAKDHGVTVVAGHDPSGGLARALQEIEEEAQRKRSSVLVLGRYRYSRDALPRDTWNGSLNVEFSTVHGAKGREADYAVVLDLKDDRRGFPSKIEDDRLMDLALPPITGVAFPFAEERRLFYVAMTRARNGVYLVTDPLRPSTFIVELLRESRGLRRLGQLAQECPRCPSGRLTPSQSRKNLRCSNYPNCEHLAPLCPNCNLGYAVVDKLLQRPRCTNQACSRPLDSCPRCGIGILTLVKGKFGSFWGCTEYRSDPSCRYRQNVISRAFGRSA